MKDLSLRSGKCSGCGTSLSRALLREVRHYELTRLFEVTCVGCEATFLAVEAEDHREGAIEIDDVRASAKALATARSLSDLFDPSDLDFPDAA